MTESQILAGLLDNARDLTRFYLSKLKEVNPHHQFVIEGSVQLNSYFWILGHLTWAENLLVLHVLGYSQLEVYPWLDRFRLGSMDGEKDGMPEFMVVLDAFKKVHALAIEKLSSAPLEELDLESSLAFNFGRGNSVREIIKHAIRHESVHCGHLGLICKVNGIKTI